MIYQIPSLSGDDQEVLALIEGQRLQLKHYVSHNPTRWTGLLRRNTLARALQGSNSIEGYDANLDDVAAIVDDEKPETLEEETYRALIGYRNSMTFIVRMHDDPYFSLTAQVIRTIHFMMLSYDLTKMPGQWRPGHIYVVHEPTGETVYEGPDSAHVPSLVDDLIDQLSGNRDLNPLVRGAMAHLNLTMIHPFKDGNGRMARAIQTLVLARDGILSPVYCSIEEWLGRNTNDYYQILAETGKGHWRPEASALNWVRFCLKAHYQQAATLIRRNIEYGRVWEAVTGMLRAHGLHERCDSALVEAAFGFRIRNSRYRTEAEISDVVASRDLKRLSDLNLLIPVGDKRGRHYVAAPALKAVREQTSDLRRAAEDPYAVIKRTVQPALPGIR